MKFIKNFYRKNFFSRGKRLLLELIDSKNDFLFGIVLEEIGLPSGHVTLHRWWKTEEAAFYEQISFEGIEGVGVSHGIIERDPAEFDNVFTFVDAADRSKLKSFSSTLRDGVLYSLSWGSKERLGTLTIDNPTVGSPHDHIVKNIKNSRWQ